ncbi:hypothetical protein Tdes44962_MAKER01495 [Teratosphaeria destructans]|uniref:Uncharacterized protein n=1 Tax=Teratosphaeria destructans TaxID=418781 RepID=A0A9W7SZD1_9PEZI|nr:hypothetical protein Tdes44962_MAKER01495 [Teratosphaeria destructans]
MALATFSIYNMATIARPAPRRPPASTGAAVCAAPALDALELAADAALDALELAADAADVAADPAADPIDSAPLVMVLTMLPPAFVATV